MATTALRREPHPLTGTIYEHLGDGKVKVQAEGSNSFGLFTWRGEWLEGEVTQADPLMLLYIGGPDLPLDHEVMWMSAPIESYDGTKPINPLPGTHWDDLPRTVSAYSPDVGKETPEGWRSKEWYDPEFFLENDRHPENIPDAYRLRNPYAGGPKKISTDRYWKQEYHDLEVEKIWKKTWQFACREDEIPNLGDYHVYEIAGLSYLIVRTADGIKAHQNICLHRGRLLKDQSGKGERVFRCPYHGWSWNLDGSLKEITCEWDFPGVREDAAQLPGARVGLWEGFVFINPDMTATETLEQFLGPVMIEHYKPYSFDNRYIQANVSKHLRCNWKVVMEAFSEAYHVIATHPHQLLMSNDLSNTHYDVFGNFGRAAQFPSPGSPQRGISVGKEDALKQFYAAADGQKMLIKALTGEDISHYSDSVMNGTGFNDLFPNMHPWGGWMRIVFRFRPGATPDESIMDIYLLSPWPKDRPKPAPAKHRTLGFDEAWTSAPELLSLSKITDQDVFNVPAVQKGLKAKSPPYVWLSAYQEQKIRHFHDLYEAALGIADKAVAG